MDLKHAQVGERIELYVFSPTVGGEINVAYTPACIGQCHTIPATVIRQEPSFFATTLAWTTLEEYPSDPHRTFTVDVPFVWKQQGFIIAYRYGSHCQYKPAGQALFVASKEAPCKQCGKQNDLGSSKCWWCEALSPTVS